jgi:hypothetical protein
MDFILMAIDEKISQAFELVFAEGDPHRRRSAIVIFDAPESPLKTQDRQLRKAAEQAKANHANEQINRDVFAGCLP